MYILELSRNELKTLAWVADRYTSAQILYDDMHSDDVYSTYDPNETLVYQINEHTAWEYREAIPYDWSYSNPNDCPHIIPPCIGGTLGDKLADLYERIV